MKQFVSTKKGPVIIKSVSSHVLSDAYRDKLAISYQFIGNVVPSVSFTLGGRNFATPIMAGPIKNEGKALEYACAVMEAGSVYWASYHGKEEWTQVLAAGIPAIRVIKPLADNDRLQEEIAFDTEHGAIGYAMDISHGMTVYGERDGQAEKFASKTVEDFRFLNAISDLPFFLKDVLSVRDALLAARAGVAGIVLSGHNNRFPCAVPPLKLLADIRKAVGNNLMILVDGGLNTGYDVFKALALGADGVLCARALMGAFTNSGADGLTDKLLEMTAELKGAMANTGSPDLQHINRECLVEL